MDWFMGRVGALSDLSLLLSGLILIGTFALMVAWLARWLLFSGQAEDAASQSKLAELVHGSLLAFTVFTLALVLSDVRTNLGKTLDSTLREASFISRLDAELAVSTGTDAAQARSDLRAYVAAVTDYDWPALEQRVPSLSREADAALKSLRASVRAAAQANPDSASAIRGFLSQMEDYRLGRLESATKSVTAVFWWTIFAFLMGAMVMNGRHPAGKASNALIFIHMGGIGLVLALILAMDQPFRGESSVSPDPLTRLLSAQGAPEPLSGTE
jgi:hypothetical protein